MPENCLPVGFQNTIAQVRQILRSSGAYVKTPLFSDEGAASGPSRNALYVFLSEQDKLQAWSDGKLLDDFFLYNPTHQFAEEKLFKFVAPDPDSLEVQAQIDCVCRENQTMAELDDESIVRSSQFDSFNSPSRVAYPISIDISRFELCYGRDVCLTVVPTHEELADYLTMQQKIHAEITDWAGGRDYVPEYLLNRLFSKTPALHIKWFPFLEGGFSVDHKGTLRTDDESLFPYSDPSHVPCVRILKAHQVANRLYCSEYMEHAIRAVMKGEPSPFTFTRREG